MSKKKSKRTLVLRNLPPETPPNAGIVIRIPNELVAMSELAKIRDPKNRNEHPPDQIEELVEQFKYQGVRHPIIISNRSGLIAAGDGRFQAALQAGMTHYPVSRQDFVSEDQEYAFRVADNAIQAWSILNLKGINEDLQELDGSTFDIARLAIKDFTLDPGDNEGECDPDEVPENGKPIVKPGEVYILGEHKLLCADSTDEEQVKLLLGEDTVDMVFTDPPYNVDYTGKTKQALKIQNDKMGPAEFRDFLTRAFKAAASVTIPGGAIYVAHADSEGYNFRGAMVDSGWLLKQCVIWVKQSIVMGRQDYHWQHEPILYGWREGGSHNWCGDRKQSTVWPIDRPSKSEEHPTMKPVELVQKALKNSSKPGQIVFDGFCGSGSTLIACEVTNRRCRAIELDPVYCGVILDRWAKFTGKDPHREDGISWAEIKSNG